MDAIRRMLRDESGVSAIEYALLAATIAIGIVTGLGELGGSVANGYSETETELAKAAPGKGKGKGNGNGKDKPDKPGKPKP